MTSRTKVAVLAPARLREAFNVLLGASPGVRLLANGTNLEWLLPALGEQVPGVILVYVDESPDESSRYQIPCEQIAEINNHWPAANCIAVLKHTELREKAFLLGADQVFHDGVAPEKLLQSIEAFETNKTHR